MIARIRAEIRIHLVAQAPQLLDILLSEPDVQCTEILLDVLELLRTRNGNDIIALREQPREGNLRGRSVVFLPNGSEGLDQGVDSRPIFRLILGNRASEVTFFEIVEGFLSIHKATNKNVQLR
jgi:hypothetical protein